MTPNQVDEAPAVKTIGALPAWRLHANPFRPRFGAGREVICWSAARGTVCVEPAKLVSPVLVKVAVANGAGAGGGGVATVVFFPPQPISAQISTLAHKMKAHGPSLLGIPYLPECLDVTGRIVPP